MRGDVERLTETGRIEETTSFGPDAANRFYYAIAMSPDISEPKAEFSGGGLTVVIPRDMGAEWARSDRVGIESVQAVPGKGELKILIEKDFACKRRSGREEEPDTYPNPLGEAC